MAWSPISMGISQGKEDGSIQLFSRSSFRNKYSSFSWTEDETAAANREVRNHHHNHSRAIFSNLLFSGLQLDEGTDPARRKQETIRKDKRTRRARRKIRLHATSACDRLVLEERIRSVLAAWRHDRRTTLRKHPVATGKHWRNTLKIDCKICTVLRAGCFSRNILSI